MSKAGAVLIALLTTGMAEGGAQKKDLWMFISGMSASLSSLSVTSLSNAPLSFKITRQNEYINFYKANDFKLDDGTSITEIGLRLSKDNGDMAPLLIFHRQVNA
ncbi:hypothetical protein L8Q94_22555 [Enterobacter kobei]|uniref:hypothetical protein n=1 Tax=Enterobacter kobei TaxID=208224 RepID=UPI00200415B9|nr:hypothetical protein [Enterobacter kobei]MCK6826110.1 hypothetical protein [Enterobacter kobei]